MVNLNLDFQWEFQLIAELKKFMSTYTCSYLSNNITSNAFGKWHQTGKRAPNFVKKALYKSYNHRHFEN